MALAGESAACSSTLALSTTFSHSSCHASCGHNAGIWVWVKNCGALNTDSENSKLELCVGKLNWYTRFSLIPIFQAGRIGATHSHRGVKRPRLNLFLLSTGEFPEVPSSIHCHISFRRDAPSQQRQRFLDVAMCCQMCLFRSEYSPASI